MSNQTENLYEVWWASAGCLPDSETPCFTGTLEECEKYIAEDPDGYFESVGEYNLYGFSITDPTNWKED